MANRTKRTPKKEGDFIEGLRGGLSIAAAASAVSVGRQTVYDWRNADKAFAAAWDSAVDVGTDLIEDEARRRAVDGVKEPVYYQGEVKGYVQKYSDNLLMFILKARRPDKYKDHKVVEHRSADEQPADLSSLSKEDLKTLDRILSKTEAPKVSASVH